MDEREDCPFCGSEKLKLEVRTADVTGRNVRRVTVCVRCCRCFARGGTVSGEVPDPLFGDARSDKLTDLPELIRKAWEKWNRRAEK